MKAWSKNYHSNVIILNISKFKKMRNFHPLTVTSNSGECSNMKAKIKNTANPIKKPTHENKVRIFLHSKNQ